MATQPIKKSENMGIPQLLSPIDGIRILESSVQFCWGSIEEGLGYELQYARRRDFTDRVSVVQQNLPIADRQAYFPLESLSGGQWYWRVRGMNYEGIFGRWSPVRSFSTVTSTRKGEQARLVSPERPLILYHAFAEKRAVEDWQAIPDSLKPYSVLRAEHTQTEALLAFCELAQEHSIPIVIQLVGPHDAYSGKYARIPLPDVEHIFQRYPCVAGAMVVEQSCQGGLKQRRVAQYIIGLGRLASSYGKLAIWADGQWHGNNIWIDAGLHEELYRTIEECQDSIVPLWKMNCAWMPYAVQGPIFGLWLADAVANWGVEPESWFWYEAGFHDPGTQYGFKEGDASLCPRTFWGQMALMGLSAGACVYSFEPPNGIWEGPGKLDETARRVIFPLLEKIIQWRLIPTKQQVEGKVRIAYRSSLADASWSEDGGRLSTVYRGTFGRDHPFQMIPSTGRYYWFPVLSPLAPPDRLRGLRGIIDAQSFDEPSAARAYFDREYPPSNEAGTAWCVSVGSLRIVTNHRENGEAAESFSLPLEGAFARAKGEVEVNSYCILSQQGQGALRVHLNGKEEKRFSFSVELHGARKPSVEAVPKAGLLSSRWEEKTRTLSLEASFAQGAVDLVIT